MFQYIENDKRLYQPQKLREIHDQIIRLKFMGAKNVDIARELGVSEQTVRYTVESPMARRRMAIMSGAADAEAVDVKERIAELAPKALEVIEELMGRADRDSVRGKMAVHVLALNGHVPVQRSINLSRTISDEELDEAKRRARSARLMVEEAQIISEADD